MTGENRLIVAAAGSGKTTYMVRRALAEKDGQVLILTYTISNEAEIRQKIVSENGYVPANIHVDTWFSFLIAHGILPFQSCVFDFKVRGMELVNHRSGFRYMAGSIPVYWGEDNLERYYFNRSGQVYSDKLSKLVIRCNESSGGNVIDRISRIFRHIFVDEVQDLAGYDLDIIGKLLRSASNVTIVGDPRQVVYQTHHEARFAKYRGSDFVGYFKNEVPKKVKLVIDEKELRVSHRNSAEICQISSLLYTNYEPSEACTCDDCRAVPSAGQGLFVVSEDDVESYFQRFNPVQLRYNAATKVFDDSKASLNFGEVKGLGFDHVLIFPTEEMASWLIDHSQELKPSTRARLYVALTRARHSVGIVHASFADTTVEGFTAFNA